MVIDPEDIAEVPFGISFGGKLFAAARSEDIGLGIRPENTECIVRIGVAVLGAINDRIVTRLPALGHSRSIGPVAIYRAAPARAPGLLSLLRPGCRGPGTLERARITSSDSMRGQSGHGTSDSSVFRSLCGGPLR